MASSGSNPPEIFFQGSSGVYSGTIGAPDPLDQNANVGVEKNHDSGASQDINIPGVSNSTPSQGDDHAIEVGKVTAQGIFSFAKGKPGLVSNEFMEASELPVHLPIKIEKGTVEVCGKLLTDGRLT